MKELKVISRIFILFVLFSNIVTFGEEVNAFVSSNKIGVEDSFSFTIEAKNYKGEVEFPQIYDIPNFDLVSGPNQGTNMSWVNGNVSKSVTHKYILMPKKVGKFKIPSFQVKIGDKVYKTKEIQLEVVKGSVAQHTQTRRPRSLFDDEFFNDDFFGSRRTSPKISNKSLFVKTEVDKKNVYLNDSILVTYKVYFQSRISNPGIKDMPDFTGFLTEDVDLKKRNKTELKIINGERYNVATLYQKILYPVKCGELEIPSITFSFYVENPMSFFAGGNQVFRKSTKETVNVIDFPEPQPLNFSGAVGKFSLNSSVDKDRLKTGESLSYKLTIMGSGNLSQVTALFPTDVKGFKVFKPGNPIVKKEGNSIEKTWEIVLAPEVTGRLTIPEVSFTYFDPKLKEYVTKKTIKREVEVEKGNNASISTINTPIGEEVKLISTDIEYIETSLPLDNVTYIYKAFTFKTIFYGIPGFLFLFGLFLRINDPSKKSPEEYRKLRAFSNFKKNIKKAEKLLKKGNGKEYYSTISTSVIQYFADKLNKPNIELRIDEVSEILKQKEISEELIKSIVDIVEYCDFESYTPSGTGENIKILSEIVQLISKLEKQL